MSALWCAENCAEGMWLVWAQWQNNATPMMASVVYHHTANWVFHATSVFSFSVIVSVRFQEVEAFKRSRGFHFSCYFTLTAYAIAQCMHLFGGVNSTNQVLSAGFGFVTARATICFLVLLAYWRLPNMDTREAIMPSKPTPDPEVLKWWNKFWLRGKLTYGATMSIYMAVALFTNYKDVDLSQIHGDYNWAQLGTHPPLYGMMFHCGILFTIFCWDAILLHRSHVSWYIAFFGLVGNEVTGLMHISLWFIYGQFTLELFALIVWILSATTLLVILWTFRQKFGLNVNVTIFNKQTFWI